MKHQDPRAASDATWSTEWQQAKASLHRPKKEEVFLSIRKSSLLYMRRDAGQRWSKCPYNSAGNEEALRIEGFIKALDEVLAFEELTDA